MTVLLFGTELGVPVAEIKVNSKDDITLLDERFEVSAISEITAEDSTANIFKD